MNHHDDRLPDDETTRDADPSWLASIRAGEPDESFDDSFDDSLDDGVTVAGDDLLARIRDAVHEARGADTRAEPSRPAVAHGPASAPGPPPPRAPGMPPPPPAILPPTDYWQPPARLRPVATPTTAPLVTSTVAPKRRASPRVVAAIVAAVVIGLAVGFFVAGRGSNEPAAPTDTTTAGDVSTTAVGS